MRKKAKAVKKVTKEIDLIANMAETMYAAPGWGWQHPGGRCLADHCGDAARFGKFINPKVTRAGKELGTEGV